MTDISFPPEYVAPSVATKTTAASPVATKATVAPTIETKEAVVPPTREELLKKLRAKYSRTPRKHGKNDEFAQKLSSCVDLSQSEIKNLIEKTGAKKIAKNPLKFARQIAELLPGGSAPSAV